MFVTIHELWSIMELALGSSIFEAVPGCKHSSISVANVANADESLNHPVHFFT